MSTGFSRVQIRKRFNGVQPAEIAFIDGVTAGTATASKALVLDSSKGIATITSATITTLNSTNIDAGASGTAGTVDIFPTTASKGKLAISCTDQTGNTTVGLVAGAMGQATTLTINDPGASTASILTDKGVGGRMTTRTSSALTKNANTTYADVTGLSATLQAGATYRFRAVLPSTVASGTGGIKYCFKYTTATLTSMESTAKGYTASAVAVQHTTSTTDQADLFTQAAVVILTEIEGTMVVNAAGTLNIQMAQNTSNASDTVALVGGTLEFTRIA